MAVLLAGTEMVPEKDVPKSPARAGRARTAAGECLSPVWIGSSRVAARAGRHDCLLQTGKKRSAKSDDRQQTLQRYVQPKSKAAKVTKA